ncbi:malonyl-ACP O-methyltransferase BioC [Thermomonas aquatica]|uniref:Malonyl-[acyl-carrier protein] O-methyltransferase n=1 Tax=Thermomonas aquatica TaxID=2202149 RepID=A0A5B7ZUB7_9GAMM|nr:malonyl-ACP O-methyltransferase BioC [Thermomonas aquatica]QDA57402.1 malonyl-ACP O-methyltransferase BioC [Thermomonas aquatica]
MSAPLFDARQVRRAFSRSAASYDAAARLQHAVEARLLESLDYLDDPALKREAPQRVLDLGCGTGRASIAMQKRWPKAELVSLDLAWPMLRQAREAAKRSAGWLSNPFARRPAQVCADARALPLVDASVDVLFSNLCLQWVEDLDALFAGFRRVLKPHGLLLVSTFGPETLWELREAFAHADDAPHVSPFADIAGFGDALVRAGFHQPVLDREEETTHYQDLPALMREQRAIGATNALASRRHTLTGRARFAAAADAYEAHRGAHGLPATWEIITAMAWAPEAGTPIREGGIDVTAVPLSRIPIRRRG